MLALLLCAVAPVWPVNGSEPIERGLSPLLGLALLLLLAVAIGGAVSYFGWRDRRRHTPERRAFRALARRMRLGRRLRAALERVALERGIPPVALLISEHALNGAVEGEADSDDLRRARERVIADR